MGATLLADVITAYLDAAHIIPYSLNGGRSVIKTEYQFAWLELGMFDTGVRLTLAGDNIEHPQNALILDRTLHQIFG